MITKDSAGYSLSGANRESLAAYEKAAGDLRCLVAGAGNYAFNEFHAMMAFVGSGRTETQQAVIDLTLIEAANRSNQKALASALATERLARRGAGQPG